MTRTTPAPHDDERCARLYQQCKSGSVGFARRLLVSSGGQNRYLCAFDAEEFYDAAWETYYNRREYLEDRDDHVARLNALILSRFRDERRRSQTKKRTAPGRLVDLDQADLVAEVDDRLADRDELRELLARVRNPADARALVDHEVRGMTFEEIGASEGISAEAARRRAQRAKEQARTAPSQGQSDQAEPTDQAEQLEQARRPGQRTPSAGRARSAAPPEPAPEASPGARP